MATNGLLDGRIAVVTGAGHGIGAGTVALFAEHGATVIAVDIDGDAVTATAAGAGATAITADVRSADDVARVHDDVISAHGRVDVLVNNVGHWLSVDAFAESDPDHWQALYEVNVLHVFRMTRAFLPGMIERGDGAIVNVSSNEGSRGYPPDPVYSACKAAVIQFTKSLGVDVARHGVRVNGIGPDMTQTEQSNFARWDPPEWAGKWPTWVPVGRVGTPLDQARVILFLASELSGFLVGQTLFTDGGTTAAGGWYPTTQREGRYWTNRPLDP